MVVAAGGHELRIETGQQGAVSTFVPAAGETTGLRATSHWKAVRVVCVHAHQVSH